MKNLTTINHLKQHFSIENFVEKTVTQINKDGFGLIDEEIVLPQTESPDVFDLLIEEVKTVLKTLDLTSNLQQFIYKVDLRETDWNYFMSFQNYDNLAEAVIIREAQKVYLREMFK